MIRLKFSTTVVFILFFTAFTEIVCYEKLYVDKLRLDFLTLEDELWEYVLSTKTDHSEDPGLYLMLRFDNFDKAMENQLVDKSFLTDPLYGIGVARKTDLFIYIFSDMKIITDMYKKFQRYLRQNLSRDKSTLDEKNLITTSDIVEAVLHSKEFNVNHTITSISKKMFESKPSVIYEMFDMLTSTTPNCKLPNQSPQQVFYHFYNVLSLIELKAYVMTQFSYLAQRLEEKSNNTNLALIARERYRKRIETLTEISKGIMEVLKSSGGANIQRCKPDKYLEGENYIQLTRLLQGHIQNEADLNADRSCRKTCADYPVSTNYGCYDHESEYCKTMKPCNGKIINCGFVQSHFKACISPPWSTRRYEFVKYNKDRQTYGKENGCYYKQAHSWFRWFVHCSYCFCLCDAQGPQSDRYFNLRPVMSDVANNKVVTGLRIVKHNRIIHLQIQEGKLGPYGFIDNSTVKWVAPDNYKVTDLDTVNGKDYHTMEYTNRSLLLDNLYTHESNHIITGVRFDFIDGHLRFQINVRSFEFKTGALSNDSYYIYGTGPRNELSIEAPDIPTLARESKEVSVKNGYIKFTHSDVVKDVAQTTVPFFDSQPVTSSPPVPLSGAGIFYKGQTGYGGFIAPRVATFDFSNLMVVNFPSAKPRNDEFEDFFVPIN